MGGAFMMLRPRAPQTIYPSSIGRPDGSTSFSSLSTAAAPTSVFTTYTQPMVVTYTSAGGTSVETTQRIVTVTDAASYASLVAQTAQTSTFRTVSAASSATSTAPATTSSAAARSSSNTSILIPAIVAPVAAILVITFVLFWWFMRRRAQKAVKEQPEFVMEKRNEKSHTRDDSVHSNSSTRNLVSKKEQVPVGKDTDFDGATNDSSFELFPADHKPSPDLRAAVTKSPDHTLHSRQQSSESQNPSGPPLKPTVAVRNFSRGPSRPSTATKERDPGSAQFAHNRSMSSSGPQSPAARFDSPGRPSESRSQSPFVNRPLPRDPLDPSGRKSPAVRGPPRPTQRSEPQPPPSAYPSTDRPRHQPPRPRGPPSATPTAAAIKTTADNSSSSPSTASPSTPTGAYNGASPISQYSPIIKDTPKFGTSPTVTNPNAMRAASEAVKPLSTRKGPPAAIRTGNSPSTPQSPDFTEENMRIARLADSSRLGFYPTKSPTVTSHVSALEPPTPSPRLPPPATRDAPPSNINIPIPPTPVESTLPSKSRRVDSFANDRRSMISRLSTDDGYVDVEIDAKSDVSSLDDREKWQMEQDSRSGSRSGTGLGGYGGLGPRPPPLLQSTDSEHSGSQYSLSKN